MLVEKLDDARVELEATVERRTRELRDSNFRLSAEIATRRRSEERIRHLLEHDSLTDLPNRRFLMRWLEDALHQADAHAAMLGVMMLDLDRFKEVNDTLGHPAGDLLLRQAAARLQASAGPDAIVARMGGDEFAIVTPNSPHRKTQHSLPSSCCMPSRSHSSSMAVGPWFSPASALPSIPRAGWTATPC